MTPTDTLRASVADDWAAATRHAFTDALADGSLDPEKMSGYLQQDYLFIESFVRLLASAVAHAPSLADAVPAAQFLGLITGPENTYFLRSFEALGVAPHAEPAPETTAFLALMDQARTSGRYEQMLAVLVVAEWTYLDWATPFADRADNLPFWFGEWITLHCGDGFAGVVAYLRAQLDAVWPELLPEQQQAAQDLFQKSVACERAFFDASWDGFPVQGGMRSAD